MYVSGNQGKGLSATRLCVMADHRCYRFTIASCNRWVCSLCLMQFAFVIGLRSGLRISLFSKIDVRHLQQACSFFRFKLALYC